MNKYKNKYRSESIRLQGYDYSSEGIYFITICTRNRIPYFGTISDGKLILSDAGKIVAHQWQQTSQIRDRVILGEWVVMPNHLHGLIHLKPKYTPRRDASHASTTQDGFNQDGFNQDGFNQDGFNQDGFNQDGFNQDGFNQDGFNPSLQVNGGYKNSFGPQRNNISSIIRGFKSTCTRQIRESFIADFEWQSRFHDHIVRSQKSLSKIEQYIRENPEKWQNDRFHI